ncbi:carboxylesterase family protein [Streptomyces nigrescens]
MKTSAGTVLGRQDAGVSVFWNIPYAAAPVGTGRFAAPVAPAPWSGVRDAGDAFTEASRQLADAHAARSAAGTYAYLFRWRPAAFGGSLGACHCVELPFVFDRTELPGLRGPRALLGDGDLPPDLASRVHRAWISFAATGDPGWQPYRAEDRAEERTEDRADDRAVQIIDGRWTMSQVSGASSGA